MGMCGFLFGHSRGAKEVTGLIRRRLVVCFLSVGRRFCVYPVFSLELIFPIATSVSLIGLKRLVQGPFSSKNMLNYLRKRRKVLRYPLSACCEILFSCDLPGFSLLEVYRLSLLLYCACSQDQSISVLFCGCNGNRIIQRQGSALQVKLIL